MEKTRVTMEDIDLILDSSVVEERVFFDKVLVAVYQLPCGFCLVGQGSCVDPVNFDYTIGRRVAREDVANQLWKLEGYNLQIEIDKLAGALV